MLVLFGLAAAAILAGLVGLTVQLKREPEDEPAQADDKPRTLNVYKKHDCSISPALAEKFAQLETTLIEGMKEQGIAADWDAQETGGRRGSRQEQVQRGRGVPRPLLLSPFPGGSVPQVAAQKRILPPELEAARGYGVNEG